MEEAGFFGDTFPLDFEIGPMGIDMSTAILQMYTPEGFVIAADGREGKMGDSSYVSNHNQKIFDISGGGNHLACALSGTVRLTASMTSGEVVFDFAKETVRAASKLSQRRCKNLFGYSTRLGREVNQALLNVVKSGKIKSFGSGLHPTILPGKDGIAVIFVSGFYNGSPEYGRIAFYHNNQLLAEPDVAMFQLSLGARMVLGVPEIARLVIDTQDQRFAKYRRVPKHRPASLDDVSDVFAGCIEAHSDPEAIKIDPKCSTIGGYVHVANIRPERGFGWSIPPKSLMPDGAMMEST